MTKESIQLRRLVCSALSLALAQVIPLLTGQIPQVGSMLCPMHIPVLLCGFICGWPWGLAAGFVAPLLRHALFSVPVMPMAALMAIELAAYGGAAGVLYRLLPKRTVSIYGALIAAMVAGRLCWGGASFVLAGLQYTEISLTAVFTAAFVETLPGIALQLLLVPLIVMALKKANLIWNA